MTENDTLLVRACQWVFTVFALGMIALLLAGSDAVVFRVAALVGYAAAVVLSGPAALRWSRGGRRTVIALHLVLAPGQFLFGIAATPALLGIILSLVILALARPRFPRLAPRTRRIWLVLHVGFSAGWLGVALTMTVMAFIGLLADSHSVRHGAYEVLHTIDYAAAIPSMALSITTGLVVSLGTKWGLVRNWWVIVKFAISVSIPLVAGTWESAMADTLMTRTVDPSARPGALGVGLTVCLGAFTVALWAATLLSVVKPWGRTRWGRAADERDRGARRRPPIPSDAVPVR